MSTITWLASYPKSGNTWVRVLLANYLSPSAEPVNINQLSQYSIGEGSPRIYRRLTGNRFVDLSVEDIQKLRPMAQSLLAGIDRHPNLVKTHNAVAMLFGIPLIAPRFTKDAIYVLRNPLDVVLSYADQYGVDVDKAIEQMASPDNRTATTKAQVFQFMGSWSQHVSSWTTAPGLHLLVVKYEDLKSAPDVTFRAIAEFLRLELEPNKIGRAIENSAFENLQSQERAIGFRERSVSSAAFFRSGTAGQWRDKLTTAQIDRVVTAHGEVMARYDYLP